MFQYFIFNGINSLDMGVIMLKAPSIVIPSPKVKSVEIAGRSGVLHENIGIYQSYTKEIECHVTDRNQIESVCRWLTGGGEVIFSSEPDRVYRVFIKNQTSIQRILLNINLFMLQFETFPFKYSVNAFGEEKSITAPTAIYSKGTFQAEPIFTVYGSGGGSFFVNGTQYRLTNLSGYVTINSEIQEAYKGSTNCNMQFVAEDFPMLQVGKNEISFTGGITKIEMIPNWRWL